MCQCLASHAGVFRGAVWQITIFCSTSFSNCWLFFFSRSIIRRRAISDADQHRVVSTLRQWISYEKARHVLWWRVRFFTIVILKFIKRYSLKTYIMHNRYELRTDCWKDDPCSRPSFFQLIEKLELIMPRDAPFLWGGALSDVTENDCVADQYSTFVWILCKSDKIKLISTMNMRCYSTIRLIVSLITLLHPLAFLI